MGATKIKLDSDLVDRAERFAEQAGYSNVEEFITHIVERELAKTEDAGSEEDIKERLRGLGYIS